MCLILISAIMAVLFFYMGLLNNDGSRVFYVVLPYVLQFLPIAYTVMSSVSLYPKDILTVVQYEKSYVRIKASGTWILILSIAGSIGDIIYIFGKYGNKIELELTFLICNFAMAILAIIILRIHNRIKFKIITRDG
ncbi:hypothetical protein ODU73_000750 [Thermoclostridium stercorarium]|nr:hypothetical protein [Thermoclostridium stercorarium]UZQ86325.1 hypothetical protein ODU73_000750 [Thermoclostridium stercorarium]